MTTISISKQGVLTDARRSSNVLQALLLLSCAGILLALPMDVLGSVLIAELAGDGTILRRAFKLPSHLYRWPGFAILAIILAFQVERRKRLQEFGLCLGVTVGLIHLIKVTLGRARPDQNLGAFHFAPGSDLNVGFDSFPSGHSTTAILMAILFCRYFPKLSWLWIPPAILTCLARIAQERHFPSDCFGGAALALCVFLVVHHRLGKNSFPALTLQHLARQPASANL